MCGWHFCSALPRSNRSNNGSKKRSRKKEPPMTESTGTMEFVKEEKEDSSDAETHGEQRGV